MKHLIVFVHMLIFSFSTFAQFSGEGLGSEKVPYVITNADELFEVRNDLSANYRLANNIDLTEWIAENNPQKGWNPIGNEDRPFTGVFDGNNFAIIGLYINREVENTGMWGVIKGAKIKNVSFVNPIINGSNQVGIVTGKILVPYNSTISCVSVIAGLVSGTQKVGGIVGDVTLDFSGYCGSKNDPKPRGMAIISSECIRGCSVEANIIGSSDVGGICGACNGEFAQYHYDSHFIEVLVADNRFSGKISGINSVGGIIGQIMTTPGEHYTSGGTYGGSFTRNGNYTTCIRNLSSGCIDSKTLAGGITGFYNDDQMDSSYFGVSSNSKIDYNVACIDTIYGLEIHRISNCDFSNNIANSDMTGIINNKSITFDDDGSNGSGLGKKILKRKTTYEGLGFDFTNIWAINESHSYPYSIEQSSTPVVDNFYAGSKGFISGKSPKDGYLFILCNGVRYKTYALEGKWELQLGAITENATASVSFQEESLQPSVSVLVKAEKETQIEPPHIKGDANGDGEIDAVDVVAIINHIIGKNSSSFNTLNADVNGDGQVLVDDAVRAVELIINAQ